MSSFKEYGFQPFIYKALDEIHFHQPTQVQEKLIPVVQKGKNLVGQSQTGSGKTHTFLLPLMDKIDPNATIVQVVITVPSRELATQIYEAANQLATYQTPAIRVANFVGGTDKNRQIERLKNQQPQLVIGTPGRILDLVQAQALLLHTATNFVVDEADMTLDMGFLNEVDKIAGILPKKIQMLVFSATIPEKLKPFLRKYMENPVVEQIQPRNVISENIYNWLIATKSKDKNSLIYQLLTIGNPYLAIVFANTKVRVEEIASYLKKQGLKVAQISGDIPPRERKRVMKQVQNLEFQYIVATDLAARGIDIEGVSLIINAEIPTNAEFFVHRVGRSGRNGLNGTAITLYEPKDESAVVQIENMGIAFEPKAIQNNEIVDSFDRNRRAKRTKSQDDLDVELIGLVKKKKKKIKPGYKKKIERAVKDKNKQKRKIERRQAERKNRKNKKQEYN